MVRITFVYTDYETLGVEYLIAVCREAGHTVNFVFYESEENYAGWKNKKFSYTSVVNEILETKPDIVGFSCVTDNYQCQLGCARELKTEMPKVKTIFGGIHPTAVPEIVLQNPEVDCVAIGEAEKSLVEFLTNCKTEDSFTFPYIPIRGMVFKRDSKYIGDFIEGEFFDDLNALPIPHKVPFFLAIPDSSNTYQIMASRGCPYKCSYCFNSFYQKFHRIRMVRQRSVDNVINELILAKKKYPLKKIVFLDDSFTTNTRWLLEFCEEYKEKIKLPFFCITNPQYLSKEKVKALHNAGCIWVQIGVQSLSEKMCSEVLARKSNNSKIAEAITKLKEYEIMIQVDHMLGIPGDTVELEEEALLFYNKYRPDLISVFWLTYYPGTSIIEIAKKKGILSDEDIEKINRGEKIAQGSLHTGGSMKDTKEFNSVALLFNYLPLMPRFLINFFVKTRLYRLFRIKNHVISTIIPRVIISIVNPKYFIGRALIKRFLIRFFVKSSKAKFSKNVKKDDKPSSICNFDT